MPHGSRYRVPLRRRREQKTDYQARKAFVVSGKPRLVARSSLKNTVAQIVVAKPHGDGEDKSQEPGRFVSADLPGEEAGPQFPGGIRPGYAKIQTLPSPS